MFVDNKTTEVNLRPTHKAVVSVLQRTHHGCSVALLDLLLRGFDHLWLLQLLLVECELNGIRCWLCPQIIHSCL